MATDRLLCIAVLLVMLAATALAKAPAGQPSAALAEEDQSESSALQQATAVAKRLDARLVNESGERGIVPPIERPLLLFGDDPRNLTRGILWGWGRGRPAAVAELWRGRAEDSPYAVSLTLTGLDLIAMSSDGTLKWQPAEAQIKFAPVAGAPTPDAKEPGRLRQFKEIARRFTAHEFWDPENSRFELRLLVQPVHRYHDSAAETQDGALFVLAHGTNPEVLLLIEAAGPTMETAKWQYGLVRTSNAETHVELDGKEVWMQSRVKGGSTRPQDPYRVFTLPPAIAQPADQNTAPRVPKTKSPQ